VQWQKGGVLDLVLLRQNDYVMRKISVTLGEASFH
jgi:hypothetical protein